MPTEHIRPKLKHRPLRVYYVPSAGKETEDQCVPDGPLPMIITLPTVLPTLRQPHGAGQL